jgi:2-polyprenyl-6-methoxyphenol hydroxylase-like FAD-dependent oxidoreductase
MENNRSTTEIKSTKQVLITGASITGPTVAWWLNRSGFKVTVVERSKQFRDGGQTIDIRGAARTVVQRMGLENKIRENSTHEKGLAFVDENDNVVAQFNVDQFAGEGPVAEIEVLRGELAKLLIHETEEKVEYIYGDTVTKIDDTGDKVHVQFQSGKFSEFDLVVIAEGIGSATRNMVFGEEVKRRPFNLYTAYFTIPQAKTDGEVARWYNAPGGLGVFLRPDNLGTTRAVFNMQEAPNGLEKKSAEEQKKYIREKFSQVGWETDRVLDGMDCASDFYLESVGQVRMDRWSKGRVVLVGDAAYCASPLSGMGTALALVGAYVLAGEIAKYGNPTEAFEQYEKIMRPYVAKAQNIPSFMPRLGQPQTKFGIYLQRIVLKIATNRFLGWMTSKLFAPPASAINLPNYS